MRVLVFSDIHGNYVNLKSFFNQASKLNIDKYICLGDLCNYFPDNEKVIDLIREKNITCLLGNHDNFYSNNTGLTADKKKAYHFSEQLLQSHVHLNYLKSLPLNYSFTDNGRSMFFCHGSPNNNLEGYVYPDTELEIFSNLSTDFVFMGHTHRQFIREHNGITFCNVGSIGMPRDNGKLFGFAVMDTSDFKIQLYRVLADIGQLMSAYGEQVSKEVRDLMHREEKINYPYILLNEQD